MSAPVAQRVRELVEPLIEAHDLEVVDVTHGAARVLVTIDREGGVDLDTLSRVTKLVSRALDEADPIPGRYTLEVSSPGVERPLRTPAHFSRAIDEKVTVRTVPGLEGERRVTGILAAADDEGCRIRPDDGSPERLLRYDELERARTVFEWGPAERGPRAKSRESRTEPTPKPGAAKGSRR